MPVLPSKCYLYLESYCVTYVLNLHPDCAFGVCGRQLKSMRCSTLSRSKSIAERPNAQAGEEIGEFLLDKERAPGSNSAQKCD